MSFIYITYIMKITRIYKNIFYFIFNRDSGNVFKTFILIIIKISVFQNITIRPKPFNRVIVHDQQ